MCIPSENIKFCTCPNSKNITDLPHYWILHRRMEENEFFDFQGELELPKKDENRETNEMKILNCLNSGNSFDQEIDFQDEDRLQVVVSDSSLEKKFSYYFAYKNGKWDLSCEGGFELVNEFESVKEGKITF
jgi:hypothetical protein